MPKIKRRIITIDEKLCNGCEACIPACHEQAIAIVETKDGPKARLVKDIYCDGLGACLGKCPTGALKIEEKETYAYDDKATKEHIHSKGKNACSCPSSEPMQLKKTTNIKSQISNLESELQNWPVQMHLISPSAPYFKNADIALIADCVPFACANAHVKFIKDRIVIIGCPKLDDTDAYLEKLSDLFATATPKSIKIVHMEVPCCFGLEQLVKEAIKKSGKSIPYSKVVVGIKGNIVSE